MPKAVLISIRPAWCEKIIDGQKTVEVRKSHPRLDTPFKCYIYCTKDAKDSDRLCVLNAQQRAEYNGLAAVCANLPEQPGRYSIGNGKVIGEFVCDKIDKLIQIGYTNVSEPYRYKISNSPFEVLDPEQLLGAACLTEKNIEEYLKGRIGYGWHISDLEIYDKPMELEEFCCPPELYCEKERCGGCPYDQVADVFGEYSYDCEWRRPIVRAPQSWCYVEE